MSCATVSYRLNEEPAVLLLYISVTLSVLLLPLLCAKNGMTSAEKSAKPSCGRLTLVAYSNVGMLYTSRAQKRLDQIKVKWVTRLGYTFLRGTTQALMSPFLYVQPHVSTSRRATDVCVLFLCTQ